MRNLFILFSLFIGINLYSQGCSDAGFCSLRSQVPMTNLLKINPKNSREIRIGSTYGKGDNFVNSINSFVEFTQKANKDISFSGKINMLNHYGNDIQTGEIGDVTLSGNFVLEPRLRATIGFVIPLHQGDKIKAGKVMPMNYQPTLGTLDLLFSLQTYFEKWHISSGVQVPLTQNNNQFFSSNLVNSEIFSTTNKYYRNPDFFLRLSRVIEAGKFDFIPSILPIYRIAEDKYTDAFGFQQRLYGSNGLTLNTSMQIDYRASDNLVIGLNGAMPLINRESRPDGLGRKYVATLDIRHSF